MPLWLARVILYTPVPLFLLWAVWQTVKHEDRPVLTWLKMSAILLGLLAVAAGITTVFAAAVVTVWNAP
jgi:uncharacterized membrane-anchored protein